MGNKVKRITLLLFIGIFVFILTACGSTTANDVVADAINQVIEENKEIIGGGTSSDDEQNTFGTTKITGYIEEDDLKKYTIQNEDELTAYLYELTSNLYAVENTVCIATEYMAVIGISQASFTTSAYMFNQGEEQFEDIYDQIILEIRTLAYSYSESVAEQFENMDGYPVLIIMLSSYNPDNVLAVEFDGELIYTAVTYESEEEENEEIISDNYADISDEALDSEESTIEEDEGE